MSMDGRIQDAAYSDRSLMGGGKIGSLSGTSMKSAVAIERQQTAFSDAASAMCDARLLATRVSSLVDRFCGPVPTDDGRDGRAECYSTILSDLRSDAELTASAIRFAIERLNRLEHELP